MTRENGCIFEQNSGSCSENAMAESLPKLSVTPGFFLLIGLLLSGALAETVIIWMITENALVLGCVLGYGIFTITASALFLIWVRQKLTRFCDLICQLLEDMMSGNIHKSRFYEKDTLFYKVLHRLSRLYEVLKESRENVSRERSDLKELISDISHQVKTPVANLKMINATLLEKNVPEHQRMEFLTAMSGQLDQLDFLMAAMVKTSRLESGIITLKPKLQDIYETLAAAMGTILLSAEKKKIKVTVDCPQTICAAHDRKWTKEALANILDNGIKYTPESGQLSVSVTAMEAYIKIDIADTGKGIPEDRQGTVFKRFYREPEVHDVPGIGLGLYLARQIISHQGGFIRITSKPGCGTTFSVFLLKHM